MYAVEFSMGQYIKFQNGRGTKHNDPNRGIVDYKR